MSTLTPPFEAYSGESGYVFASYAHADADEVYPILTRLRGAGFRIWYDEGIEPGEGWSHKVGAAIERCSVFLLFVSVVSVARPGVINEIDIAHKRNRPFLTVFLEEVVLPVGIEYASGAIQAVAPGEFSKDGIFDKVCAMFIERGVVIDEPPPVFSELKAPLADLGMKPGRPRQRVKQSAVSVQFADRVPESVALRASYEFQRKRLTNLEPIADEVYPNILVFYGGWGVGKSGLSRRLQQWMCGGLDDSAEWGRWPHDDVVTPVRWDFHESTGSFDLVHLMLTLRAALVPLGRTWGAFDIALARYLEAVRPGRQNSLGLSGPAEDQVLRAFKAIIAQLRLGSASDLTPAVVRLVCGQLMEPHNADHPLRAREVLTDVLTDIQSISQGSQAPDIVVDLLYLLTEEIHAIVPTERPMLVFFLDPFEKVQNEWGERILADCVAALPFALFVITGRNHLRWAETGYTRLTHAGPKAWPGLVVDGSTADPRQHLLGRLSDTDTGLLYRSRRNEAGWNMSDSTIDKLVARSPGLPLHVTAVLKVAENLEMSAPGRNFTYDDVAGELPEVVTRLLDTLTRDEADAFRAACVLPSFDVLLAAAVGNVGGAEVEKAISDALVDHDDSSVYPYRVHDEIRRLVRLDRTSHGYWTTEEWTIAARRGMDAAVKRITAGIEDDAAALQAIALAINIGHEWDIYPSEMAGLVQDGPSIVALVPNIPPVSEARPQSDVGHLIQYIHALNLPYEEGGDALGRIHPIDEHLGWHVKLWTAYRFRSVGRFDEALEVFADLAENGARRLGRVHYQAAVTLRTCRRFIDGVAYVETNVPARALEYNRVIRRLHGFPDYDPEDIARRLAGTSSRRYQNELIVGNLLARYRTVGDVTSEDIDATAQHALDLGHKEDYRSCLLLKGYQAIADESCYNDALMRLEKHIQSYKSTSPSAQHLRTLRAMYTRDPDDAREAYECLQTLKGERGVAWIPIEMWLDYLGYEVAPYPTQWLVPYEQVRSNWVQMADRIIGFALQQR